MIRVFRHYIPRSLLILGTVGEYIGRIFLDQSSTPQFVVRYIRGKDAADG